MAPQVDQYFELFGVRTIDPLGPPNRSEVRAPQLLGLPPCRDDLCWGRNFTCCQRTFSQRTWTSTARREKSPQSRDISEMAHLDTGNNRDRKKPGCILEPSFSDNSCKDSHLQLPGSIGPESKSRYRQSSSHEKPARQPAASGTQKPLVSRNSTLWWTRHRAPGAIPTPPSRPAALICESLSSCILLPPEHL